MFKVEKSNNVFYIDSPNVLALTKVPSEMTEKESVDSEGHRQSQTISQEEQYFIDQICKNRALIEEVRDGLRGEAKVYVVPQDWTLQIEPRGAGATYYLLDANGKRQGVIKPNDEDVLMMNNPKGWFSLDDHCFYPWLPGYQSAQTATLCSEIAQIVGIGHITPKTELMIIDHESFHLIYDDFDEQLASLVSGEMGLISREKLVSIQEYLTDALPFDEAYHDALVQQEEFLLDQADFEAVMVFMWLTFENDGHLGNFLVDHREDGKWGVRKVDNNLSLPEENCGYHNALGYFKANMDHKLSDEMRSLIANIDVEKILDAFDRLGKSARSKEAFLERCTLLQKMSEKGASLQTIEQEMVRMGDENEVAMDMWGNSSSGSFKSGGCDEAY